MSNEYKVVLGQIRDAYVRVQSGALRPSVWKREGASSYTVQRAKPAANTSMKATTVANDGARRK